MSIGSISPTSTMRLCTPSCVRSRCGTHSVILRHSSRTAHAGLTACRPSAWRYAMSFSCYLRLSTRSEHGGRRASATGASACNQGAFEHTCRVALFSHGTAASCRTCSGDLGRPYGSAVPRPCGSAGLERSELDKLCFSSSPDSD